METPATTTLSIRLPADLRSWLTVRAEAKRGSSLNSEIVEVLCATMKAEPNYITVRHCKTRMGIFYAAAWNESTDDFYSGEYGQDEEKAFTAVKAEIAKRGFKLRDILVSHRAETLTLERSTDDADTNVR
jgi:hypothetical protein